jgi:hypothetical protein
MSTDALDLAPARRQSIATLLAGWTAGGSLAIYSSPRPASANDAVGAATLLCTFTFSDPSGTVTDGVWTADPLPEAALIVATDTAAWARLRDDADATIADGSVGVTASGEAVTLATLALVAGYSVVCTACSITA